MEYKHHPNKPGREYEVACVCSLLVEYEAVCASLDSIHQDIDYGLSNQRITLGAIGKINVLVILADNLSGVSRTVAVEELQRRFPSLRLALSIGLCGGVPDTPDDIKLGDVIVSTSVIQFDFGRSFDFDNKIPLNLQGWPPKYLAGIINAMKTTVDVPKQLRILLEAVQKAMPSISSKKEENWHDIHLLCPKVHYGMLASLNVVPKNAKLRAQLAQHPKVMAFEMEATTYLDYVNLPMIIIRGVSDFLDEDKQKNWQLRAILAASAYAKLFLQLVERANDVTKNRDLYATLMNHALSTPYEASCRPHSIQRSKVSFICWNLPEAHTDVGIGRAALMPKQSQPAFTYKDLLVEEGLNQLEKRFRVPEYTCKPVSVQDVCPGSKYRGICKLSMIYEKCPHEEYVGTGWMISKSTVVTAGHNVYDKAFGHAIRILVQLGYGFEHNDCDIDVKPEVRCVRHVAVNANNYEKGTQECDLAVLTINEDFKDVTMFSYKEPDMSETAELRIVGFPAGEFTSNGEVMYESCGTITWNLPVTGYRLLHKLDTSGGSSGSPVFRVDGPSLVAIGVHTWGTKQEPDSTNAAVVISNTANVGGLGNIIPAFLEALSVQENPVGYQERSISVETMQCTAPIKLLRKISIPLTI